MSDFRMTSQANSRILPNDMGSELQRLPLRIVGGALVLMVVFGWVSLLTWTIGDPSLNRATSGAANNLLGSMGASLADMLFQTMGLAAITLFLPPLVWGIDMVRGEYVSSPRHRVMMWMLAIVLLTSTLSIVPRPSGWFLVHGLGGVIGDNGQSIFHRIGGFLEPRFASILGGVMSGALGAWALVRACGMNGQDFKMLWQWSSSDAKSGVKIAASSDGKSLWRKGFGSVMNAGRYAVRLVVPASSSAAAKSEEPKLAPNPREYWLNDDPNPFMSPREPSEGSFDPRFSAYDFFDDDEDVEIAPRPVKRAPAPTAAPTHAPASTYAPASAHTRGAPSALPDGRIEPYFGAMNGAAQDDGEDEAYTCQRVTVVPFSPSERIAQPPARQAPVPAAAAKQQQLEQPHAPVREMHARIEERFHDPLAFEADDDNDDDDDGFDDSPFESACPIASPIPQEPSRRAPPVKPEVIRRPANGAASSPAMPNRGQRSRGGAGATNSARAVFPGQQEAEFILPPMKLLNPAPQRHNNPELSDVALGRRAEMLQGVLEDFGIKGQITGVHPGPVITLYELEPARGTKSSRVIGLADDIARSMSATSCRVAVIPGRDAMGIELPNQNREVVYLRELLEASDFKGTKARLPLALGKTIGGAPVTVDLARMPHLLIAGTTGSGKSVAINTMILSLLYRHKPEECRFIMIDPKMLELSIYDDIPHLLTPVVTDPKKAVTALKWTVNEMTDRYERMCKLGVRNIQGFNQKVTRAAAQGRPLGRTVQTGFDEDTGNAIYEQEEVDCSPMPYIVVVIDEMADLMMVAGKEIEFAVQRLSQMARAAGIHLIMATQRPSVDVITGTIKANFPSRISFQVASKIDSRTILGEHGAEQLLGAGDMLTMAGGGRIMRAHGPFVSDEEVENVVTFLKAQGEPDYLDCVLEDTGGNNNDAPRGSSRNDVSAGSGDDLYDQAVNLVLRERRATTSYLQRRLGIGYNHAATLIKQMEQEGLISAPSRTGKRDILVGEEA
ncbi:MAG: DNA translocase FtsK 4TM domain-containing protein [Alphaproteobacteria bacterium]